MAQTSKFIDVTRTFVPINPNAFPESLSTSSQMESPEKAIPVMAYKGYNFLPTAYGYKSYFGNNQKLGISPLVARVDYVFNYQNKQYENILIALTDSGIWIKKGIEAGAWVNSVPMPVSDNLSIHYEWTFCIIANVLYCYRQGFDSYQKIESNVADSVTITSVVPTFLNMVAQSGIFRADGRLAFWDSADSIGWCNLDDFGDFTPSLETLAGNSTFTDVQGRIVTIKSHGAGFIIYATRSVVYVAQNIENAYQWNPRVVLSNCGISYPRQVAEASPDTIHFAYTQQGMKKIEMGKEDTVVTEVTDYLKEYSGPIYLRILQGRYLVLELLDDDYVVGEVQLTDEVIPAIDYVFPGATYPILNSIPDNSNPATSLCNSIAGLNAGAFEQGQPTVPPADRRPGTFYTPIWTAYLSNGMVADADNIVFGPSPCPTVDPFGIDANMCPTSGVVKLGDLTQDTVNKQASTGAQAYVDGNWTIQRFIAAQTAIWERQDKALQAVISKVLSRAKSVTRVTANTLTCVAVALVRSECALGRYVTKFSSPKFGWSPCEFWLTRYAIGATDIARVKADQTTCTPVGEIFAAGWTGGATISGGSPAIPPGPYASATDFVAAVNATEVLPSERNYILGEVVQSSPLGVPTAYNIRRTGSTAIWGSASRGYIGQGFNKLETMNAYNKGTDVEVGVLAADTAFCRITGWKYTKNDGTIGILPATTCNSPSTYPTAGGSTKAGVSAPPVSKEDGSMCGTPYLAPMLPNISGIGSSLYTWPTQTVTIPAGTFLLQKGSIAPVYPTFAGGLVYDLELKKWGKYRLSYKQLLDYSPINSSMNGVIPYNTFGILSGVINGAGIISLFDQYPTDSYISYGKIGYDRLAKSKVEEVHIHFKSVCTGYVKVETALEGKALSAGLVIQTNYTNAMSHSIYGAYPGQWYNIEIGGIFDIQYLEYRGFNNGRR